MIISIDGWTMSNIANTIRDFSRELQY